MILRLLSSLVETYFVNYVGEKVVVDMRLELYSHLQMLSLGFYSEGVSASWCRACPAT
ncbi:MAG: hypothetical protein U0521_29860 [Anaerolineae bacterium]